MIPDVSRHFHESMIHDSGMRSRGGIALLTEEVQSQIPICMREDFGQKPSQSFQVRPPSEIPDEPHVYSIVARGAVTVIHHVIEDGRNDD